MRYAKDPDMFSISKSYTLLCGRTRLIARSTDSPLIFNVQKVEKNERGEEETKNIGEVFTPDPLALCDALGLSPLKTFVITTTICEKRRNEAMCKTFETIQIKNNYTTKPSSISFANDEKKYSVTYGNEGKIRITITDYTRGGAVNVLDVGMSELPKALTELDKIINAGLKDFSKTFDSMTSYINSTLNAKKRNKKEMEMS